MTDPFLTAEDEGTAAAAAGRARPSRRQDTSDECPDPGRLLKGAETGYFSPAEFRHLGQECRFCRRSLDRAFSDLSSFSKRCPPADLAARARSGALRGAVAAHAANCGCSHTSSSCQRRRLSAAGAARGLRSWRAGDPTRRLGTWLGLVGVTVVIVGHQSRSLGLPWGSAQLGLGLATFVVASYLGAPRDLLAARGPARHQIAVGRLHRAALSVALLALGFLAGVTAWRFRPSGTHPLAIDLARLGMGGGALFAATACLIGCAGVALRRAPSRAKESSWRRPGRRLCRTMHPRAVLTRGAMGACGAACIVYSAVHVVVALAIAPSVELQVALLAGAPLLLLAALESFHAYLAYERLVYRWFQWGIIEVPCGPDLPRGMGDAVRSRGAEGNSPSLTDTDTDTGTDRTA